MSLPAELQNLFHRDCEYHTKTWHPLVPNVTYTTGNLTAKFWGKLPLYPLEVSNRSNGGSHVTCMDFNLSAAKGLSVIIGKLTDDIDDAYEMALKLDLLSALTTNSWGYSK